MSKVSRVIVLCPNGRRETINVTPNSNILQILEEACQKQKINPNDFDLCHYKKPLDLSLPVRFANLANNAQLELQPAKNVRKDCLVTVGLQLESGERIMKEFLPSSSIWNVMEQCLSTRSEENFNERGEPVCIYMRQTLTGDDLKDTTLRSLGLTQGSAIIRLIYRNPDDLSEQAHVSAPLTKPSKELSRISNISPNNNTSMEWDPPVEKPQTNVTTYNFPVNTNVPNINYEKQKLSQDPLLMHEKWDSFQNMPLQGGRVLDDRSIKGVNIVERKLETNSTAASVSKVPVHQEMEFSSVPVEEEVGDIFYIGDRHAVIYSLDDITNVKKADFPEEFFKVTVDDLKYLLQDFKKIRQKMENTPLMTKELRRRQMHKTLGRYKQTVIRIHFPERLVLQAVFEADETVQDVCDFISNYLEDTSLKFYLYTTPPKQKKDPANSLIESELIPAAVMYFGSETHCPHYLKDSLREKISDPRAASLAACESRKKAESDVIEEIPYEPEEIPNSKAEIAEEYKAPGPSSEQPSTSVQSSEKVPKWLKLGRK